MRTLNPAYVEAVQSVVNPCPFFSLLSMKIMELGMGTALLHIDLEEKHLQPFGVVHGGAFCSIIDAAAFWAVFSEVAEGVGMTSVDLKLNYLAPAVHGQLVATGRCIKLGKTLGLGEAQVTNESGKVLAHGTSTLMVIPGFEFGPKGMLPAKFIEE